MFVEGGPVYLLFVVVAGRPVAFFEWKSHEPVWHADAYRRILEDFDEHVIGEVASPRPNP